MTRYPSDCGFNYFLKGNGWGDSSAGNGEGDSDCWEDVFYSYRPNVRESRPAPYQDYEDVRVPD